MDIRFQRVHIRLILFGDLPDALVLHQIIHIAVRVQQHLQAGKAPGLGNPLQLGPQLPPPLGDIGFQPGGRLFLRLNLPVLLPDVRFQRFQFPVQQPHLPDDVVDLGAKILQMLLLILQILFGSRRLVLQLLFLAFQRR